MQRAEGRMGPSGPGEPGDARCYCNLTLGVAFIQGGGCTREGTEGGPQAHMEGVVFTTRMRWSRCVRVVGDSLLRGMEEATRSLPLKVTPLPT